jgi:hypothetical protein
LPLLGRETSSSSCSGCTSTPIQLRSTRPVRMIWSTTSCTTEDGIENPRLFASTKARELIPTTSPERSTSGPPLFPGLMAASVWIQVLKNPVFSPVGSR